MFVLVTELVGPEKRALAGTLVWLFFTAALMVLGLKVYFIRNWRTLLIQVEDGLFGAVMAMRRTILNPYEMSPRIHFLFELKAFVWSV